jgi:hypothetical protein
MGTDHNQHFSDASFESHSSLSICIPSKPQGSKIAQNPNSAQPYGRHDFSDHNYVQQMPHLDNSRKRKLDTQIPEREFGGSPQFSPAALRGERVLTWDNKPSRFESHKFSSSPNSNHRSYDCFDEEIDTGKSKKIKQRESLDDHRNAPYSNQFQSQYERNNWSEDKHHYRQNGN